jgi:hypothetical protein
MTYLLILIALTVPIGLLVTLCIRRYGIHEYNDYRKDDS